MCYEPRASVLCSGRQQGWTWCLLDLYQSIKYSAPRSCVRYQDSPSEHQGAPEGAVVKLICWWRSLQRIQRKPLQIIQISLNCITSVSEASPPHIKNVNLRVPYSSVGWAGVPYAEAAVAACHSPSHCLPISCLSWLSCQLKPKKCSLEEKRKVESLFCLQDVWILKKKKSFECETLDFPVSTSVEVRPLARVPTQSCALYSYPFLSAFIFGPQWCEWNWRFREEILILLFSPVHSQRTHYQGPACTTLLPS